MDNVTSSVNKGQSTGVVRLSTTTGFTKYLVTVILDRSKRIRSLLPSHQPMYEKPTSSPNHQRPHDRRYTHKRFRRRRHRRCRCVLSPSRSYREVVGVHVSMVTVTIVSSPRDHPCPDTHGRYTYKYTRRHRRVPRPTQVPLVRIKWDRRHNHFPTPRSFTSRETDTRTFTRLPLRSCHVPYPPPPREYDRSHWTVPDVRGCVTISSPPLQTGTCEHDRFVKPVTDIHWCMSVSPYPLRRQPLPTFV